MAQKKTGKKNTNKQRTKKRMPHVRNVDELSFLCRHVRDRITAIEQQYGAELEKSDEYVHAALAEKKKGNKEGYIEYAKKYKEIQAKYANRWFTNTVNGNGRIDLEGDFKKIKAGHLKQFLTEGEEKWAEAHKERTIGINCILADLRGCGVLTSPTSRTHRPVDFYGNRVLDKNKEQMNVRQVEEIHWSWLLMFADNGEEL